MPNITSFEFHPSLTQEDENGKDYKWLDIYQPDQKSNHQSAITFYLAENDLDLANVLQYKQKIKSEILVEIQTQELPDNFQSDADIVLFCQNDEVATVLKTFERMLADYAFIWIDFQYLIEVLRNTKVIHFRKTQVQGKDCVEKVTHQIFDNVNFPQAKNVLTCAIVPPDTGFEVVGKIDEIMENSMVIDTNFYNAVNFNDDSLWQQGEKGCWLGVFFCE